MSRLAPGSPWLIQQIAGEVILFHEYNEEEIVRFDPSNGNETAKKQKFIHDHPSLTEEEKVFAHFWSGYFHAHASGE